MADFNQVGSRFQNTFMRMSLNQKLSIGMTFIITGIAFVFLVKWATKPDYDLLFSQLDLKEADQIVQSLKEQNIPYKLGAGGTSVLIPSKDVYEWRMRLASEGLPSKAGIGYEVFDTKEIGISNFVQQVNYRRAIEGELARSIQQIKGVQHARVHIVIPEEKLFKEDEHEPTASIMLTLQSGARLGENQIFGISNLVAASVEGLTPDNVTIVNSKGDILTNAWKSDSVLGLSSSQLELQNKVETHLMQKAQSMLSAVLGEGKSIIRVSAKLNFQKIERTEERYDPDNIAVLSEERTDETNSNTEGASNGQLEHSITNYQVPKTVEYITNSVGDIERLSVAVLVDGTRQTVVDANGEETVQYIPRTADELNTLTGIVQNAVGFDPARNDQFEIQNIPFDTVIEDTDVEEVSMFSQPEFWLSTAQKIIPFLLIGILLLVLRSRLKKIKFSVPSMPVALSSGNVPSLTSEGIAVPKIEESVTPEARESATLLRQITDFALEKPSMAARLLRYWMIEE